MSASDLAGAVTPQEHLPVPFTSRARMAGWAALIALVAESAIYNIPTNHGKGWFDLADTLAYTFLNVWGWGWLVLIVTVTSTAVTALVAVMSHGFRTAPAWMHVALAVTPYVAAAALIPLLLFVLMYLIVLAAMAAIAVIVVIVIFLLLSGALSS